MLRIADAIDYNNDFSLKKDNKKVTRINKITKVTNNSSNNSNRNHNDFKEQFEDEIKKSKKIKTP